MSSAIVMLTALTGPSTFVSKASKPGMPIVLGNKNKPTNKPAAKYVNFVIHEHPFFLLLFYYTTSSQIVQKVRYFTIEKRGELRSRLFK